MISSNDDTEDILRGQAVILAEADAEKRMTVAEIWAAGFKVGLASAGLSSNAGPAYAKWLLERAEKRGLI